MKLTYTETRDGRVVDSANIADGETFADNFKAGIMVEISTCLDNDNPKLAKKLIDWYDSVMHSATAKTEGSTFTHIYDTRTGLTGTWTLITK